MKHQTKRILHWSGSVLAVLGIAFVVMRFRDYENTLDFSGFDASSWSAVAGLILLCGLANLMLAFAWWNLLAQLGATRSTRWAVKTYGVSQLAKYVPGNIFHLASRQAIGMAAGVAGWPLAKSSVLELGMLVVAGSIFTVLAAPLIMHDLSGSGAVILFILAETAAAGVIGYFSGRAVARAFAFHVLFLAISAAIFVCLVKLVATPSPADAAPWVALGGAYVLAWLAGFLTPGAPAGLGIREVVLLLLLKGLIGEADLLLAIVLGRAITIGGDCLFYVGASLLRVKSNAPANEPTP